MEAGGDPALEKKAWREGRSDQLEHIARQRQMKKNCAASTTERRHGSSKPMSSLPGKAAGRRDITRLIDDKAATGAEVQAIRILARLRTFFGWAVEKDWIAENPCNGLKPPTKERPASVS